jgi:hypothetical protein
MLRQAIAARDDDLLSGAVARCRRLLAAIPHADTENQSKTLRVLGLALQHRFRRHGAMADIDEAVEVGRRGADLVAEGDPDQLAILADLAAALQLRFEREGATLGRRDLDAAVTTLRRAFGLTRGGTPESASAGHSLCTTLRVRFEHYGDLADLTESVSVGREVAADLLASGQVRAAAELMSTSVGRLTAITTGRLDSDEAKQSLAGCTGLASEAAALALLDERPGQTAAERAALAFCLLEAGRTSLLGPALGMGQDDSPATARLPDLSDLLRCSGSEPVAAINISRYRSDALLLADGKVTCVPLPGLTPARLAAKIALLDRALAEARDSGTRTEPSGPNSDLSGILEWLWDTVAWPVLDELGGGDPADDPASLARIWWMPTGALGRLPLHAAGYHREGLGRTLLDRVVSSYAVTVRALGRSGDGAAGQEAALPANANPVCPADLGDPACLASVVPLKGLVFQVVGAMWEIGENSAAEVFAAFGRRFTGGPGGTDGTGGGPARALHEIVRGLRADGRAALPLAWAGYVHAGV